MIDSEKNPYVACRKCGWVSFAMTREEAQQEVDEFNASFSTWDADVRRLYGNKMSSLDDYRCRCGGTSFERVPPEAVPTGSTIGPVVWGLTPEYLAHLVANGYEVCLPIPGFRWVALSKFIFTTAVIVGDLDDMNGYADRWCYHTRDDALKGLVDWLAAGCAGEPTGWHRHPSSGRRAGPDHEFNEALKEL